MQEHLDTLLAFVEIESGRAGLPGIVTDEYDADHNCGILSQGLLRLLCNGCTQDKLVAFSYRRRGV